jgi:hypothetical protein
MFIEPAIREFGPKTDEPSLRGFIAFLKTRPAYEKYVWMSPCVCPCAQYAAHIGQQWQECAGGVWNRLNTLAYNAQPHTFGALVAYIAQSHMFLV